MIIIKCTLWFQLLRGSREIVQVNYGYVQYLQIIFYGIHSCQSSLNNFLTILLRSSCTLFAQTCLSEKIGSSELLHDKTDKMNCAPSKDSAQPGLSRSLIRVFAVRMKKHGVLSYPLSALGRLWSDWADAQADLSLHWAHSHFVGFVMRRLISILTFSVTLLLFSGYKLAQAISLCIAKVNITSVWPRAVLSSWNIHGHQSAKTIHVSDTMSWVADSQQIKIIGTQWGALQSPLPLQYFFLVTCHGVPGCLVLLAVGVSLSSSRRARAQMFYV